MTGRYLVNFDLKKIPVHRSDLLIIGGGIAGLTAALAAGDELDTTILTKGKIRQSSTWFAQGGIAAAIGEGDSVASHLEDTLAVGGNISNRKAVEALVEEAGEAIDFLIKLGTDFDRTDGQLRLAREGGHSRARVLHAGDGTGSVISASLGKAASARKRLQLKQNLFVIDLLTSADRCLGVLVFDIDAAIYEAYLAPATILATGGMGQLYRATTNPLMATGDGFAMAGRAGAQMDAMEFVQFHPTAFSIDHNPRFLISEALRGEGAYLRDERGNRFMVGIHPLAELAPRDIISREMFKVMSRSGRNNVMLDATHLPAAKISARFPAIYKYLKEKGYDLAADLIPVSPAAHYMIGGVKTDLDGRTSLPGLFASGEVASTGVHGANRLASNSLLEGLVFSRRAIRRILDHPPFNIDETIDLRETALPGAEHKDWNDIREALRKLMWDKVGIVREKSGLIEARERIASWQDILKGRQFAGPKAWEVQNMLQVAEKIVTAGLARTESIGVHYRVS